MIHPGHLVPLPDLLAVRPPIRAQQIVLHYLGILLDGRPLLLLLHVHGHGLMLLVLHQIAVGGCCLQFSRRHLTMHRHRHLKFRDLVVFREYLLRLVVVYDVDLVPHDECRLLLARALLAILLGLLALVLLAA